MEGKFFEKIDFGSGACEFEKSKRLKEIFFDEINDESEITRTAFGRFFCVLQNRE